MLIISPLRRASKPCVVSSRAAELARVWRQATADLNDRVLIIDVKGLSAITEDRENVLLELMKEGASFRSSGVFTKQILKWMAQKIRRDV